MSKHTPGPWKAELDCFDESEGIVACVTDQGINILVQVCATENRKHTSYENAKADTRMMADAALIAAAPEMYEALLLMKEYIHGHVQGGKMLDTLEAALAKAEVA